MVPPSDRTDRSRRIVRGRVPRTSGFGPDRGDGTLEIEDERRLTREEAAKWLHRLADSLERHNAVEFVRDGLRMRIGVPAEVTMEVELEIGDEHSLEIEPSW
jgi:amphi-Trp domain-containing protein